MKHRILSAVLAVSILSGASVCSLPDSLMLTSDAAERITLTVTANDLVGAGILKAAADVQGVELADVTDIIIKGTASAIVSYTFNKCDSLRSVVFPDTVTTLQGQAFYHCKAIETIVVPDTVTSIGSYAFCGCDALKSLTLPESLTAIPSQMCLECPALAAVVIPESVTVIENSAFGSCPALTDVYYAGSEAQWNAVIVEEGNEDLMQAVMHFGVSARLGDINRDISVDAEDAAMVLTAAAKRGSGNESGLTAEQEQDADVNGSGVFDAADAALILRYAASCGTGGTMIFPQYLENAELLF